MNADEQFDAEMALQEKQRREAIAAIQQCASRMPDGNPGECDECGDYFTRLVNGLCGRCRDSLGVK